MTRTARLELRLTPEELAEIEALAVAMGVSKSEAIRRAIVWAARTVIAGGPRIG